MGPHRIDLTDEAYARLDAERREDEDFSDVVERLTTKADLTDYHGSVSAETADALDDVLVDRSTLAGDDPGDDATDDEPVE